LGDEAARERGARIEEDEVVRRRCHWHRVIAIAEYRRQPFRR
jgi:hypothetical protein